MKPTIKILIIGSFTLFLIFSLFTEPNYSFWLTVAVYLMSWILANKEKTKY